MTSAASCRVGIGTSFMGPKKRYFCRKRRVGETLWRNEVSARVACTVQRAGLVKLAQQHKCKNDLNESADNNVKRLEDG